MKRFIILTIVGLLLGCDSLKQEEKFILPRVGQEFSCSNSDDCRLVEEDKTLAKYVLYNHFRRYFITVGKDGKILSIWSD